MAAEVPCGFGTLLMAEVGSSDGDGEVSNTVQEKMIKELYPWFWTWRRLSSESVCLLCGLGRRTSASQGRMRVLWVYFEHQRRVQFEGSAAEPLRTIRAILPGSKWSCLLLRSVLQDAFSEVTNLSASDTEGLCG